MTVLPFAVFVDEALPVFVWVTVVVLEFDAVALPGRDVGRRAVPVFEAFAVFVAFPPVFPAWLPSSAQLMLPPETSVVPLWLPTFTPMTPAIAVLWPRVRRCALPGLDRGALVDGEVGVATVVRGWRRRRPRPPCCCWRCC